VVVGIALIFTGAVGNIIDSLFYGLIFSGSEGQVAALFPAAGGYAPFLQGRVVDMLYFPIIEATFPGWLPVWGGEDFIFFRPVFNIADSAITTGVIYLLLFKRNYFLKKVHEENHADYAF
jgi:signal peptidase II